MHRCLKEVDVREWMNNGKTTLIQEDLLKGRTPKQLQDYNVSACDLENTNSTNKGGDLRLSNKPRTEEKKGCYTGIGEQLQIGQLEIKTRRIKSSFGVDDYKKIYMVSQSWIINILKMHKISDEVIKFKWENYGNLSSGFDRRGKELSWGKDLEKYIPERCTITITIYKSDIATQSYS